jgi:hypothetical protein
MWKLQRTQKKWEWSTCGEIKEMHRSLSLYPGLGKMSTAKNSCGMRFFPTPITKSDWQRIQLAALQLKSVLTLSSWSRHQTLQIQVLNPTDCPTLRCQSQVWASKSGYKLGFPWALPQVQ